MAHLWTPIFLPFGSLANWYDSTDTTTITLSTANKVAVWRDKSYAGNDLSEADYADLPVYGTTNINGLSTIDFDEGVAINLDDEVVPLNGNFYIIYAGFNNTYTAPSTMFNFTGTGVSSLLIRQVGANLTQWLLKDAAASVKQGTITEDVDNLRVSYTIDADEAVGMTVIANYDVSSEDSGSFTYPPLTKLTLGAQNGEFNGLNGQVGELVVVQADDISLTDKQKLEGYTAWKWGMVDELPGGHPYKSAAPTVTDVEFRDKLYETSTEEGTDRFRRLFELGFV
jgi:hypothetical protein